MTEHVSPMTEQVPLMRKQNVAYGGKGVANDENSAADDGKCVADDGTSAANEEQIAADGGKGVGNDKKVSPMAENASPMSFGSAVPPRPSPPT